MADSKGIVANSEFYDDLGKKYEDAFGHDQGLHKAIEGFLGLLSQDAHVLDCGSGTGKPVAQLISNSKRFVHGIDRSPAMIALSRTQVPKGQFDEADMLTYTPESKYDGIVASLSLFELPREDVIRMVHNFSGWLKEGGHVLIVTFAAEDTKQATSDTYDADGLCAQQVPWRFMGQSVRITLFTRAGWEKILGEQGLEVIHTEVDNFQPGGNSESEPHYFITAKKKAS